MNWFFGSSTSKSSGPSERDRRSNRSGSFSPKEIQSKIETVKNLIEEDDQTVTYTYKKTLKVRSEEKEKYLQINVQDFLEPQNATFRPKKLKIKISSKDNDNIEQTTFVWVPVPLIKHRHYEAKEFSQKETFDDEINIDVVPKMTFYQVNEKNHPVQADFTHINALNMYKDVPFTISLGSMYIVPSRKKEMKCTYDIEFTLIGLLTPY